MTAALPLQGIRVLDLSNVLAGPLSTYMFSLLGAEVIKIERPDSGDLARKFGADAERGRQFMGASFVATSAGKKSVTLDLKSEAGKAIFLRLAEKADLVFENFKPGTTEALGIDYPVLQNINPRVVYCAISGFGRSGPLSQRPAYDQIIQSMCGLMSLTGSAASGPTRAGFVVCDSFTAMTAAFASVAGLLRARTTGQGAMIDVAMLDSSLVMASWLISNYLNAGLSPKPMSNENTSSAPSGTYQAKDSLITIVCNEDWHFAAFCDAIGKPDLKADPVWANRFTRVQRRDELIALLQPILKIKSAAEWEPIFVGHGVPCAPVMSLPEIVDHPQIAGRGFIRSISGTAVWDEDIRVPTLGFDFVGEDKAPLMPPPVLGADTRSILSEIGIGPEEIERLAREKII